MSRFQNQPTQNAPHDEARFCVANSHLPFVCSPIIIEVPKWILFPFSIRQNFCMEVKTAMDDADVWFNLPFFPILMVLVAYALLRPIANGNIKLGRHLHKLILPFSQKRTTSTFFIELVCDCYLIVLIDLIGHFSGFERALGLESFNLLCFGIFTSIVALSLAIHLAVQVVTQIKYMTIIEIIVCIVFACLGAIYTVKAFSRCFCLIAKGVQAFLG